MAETDFAKKIDALTRGALSAWVGLPRLSVSDLEAIFGIGSAEDTIQLGAYPAQRLSFLLEEPGRVLVAYVRHSEVVMVEILPPPDSSALSHLPEPTAILPQEVEVEGAYAHEYLYCDRGLMLTVAQYFDRSVPNKLIRCRGIRPIAHRGELGAELYMPLDARIHWQQE